ncbi:MAG: hypothetical protein MSS82_00650 [Bacteroidales bacterium]|nr:hypothetical protein [Bacteroidales bacterium]
MSNYKWTFQNIGGTTRIKLNSGEDIRHLPELDEKMWTVLSCPVTNLQIDERSLRYIDLDGDGKIHVSEVVRTAQWLTAVLNNADLLLQESDTMPLSAICTDTGDGQRIYASARQILRNLGKETDSISVADTSDSIAIFAQTRFNGDGVITESSADTDEQKTLINAIIAATGGTPDRSGVQGINAGQIEAFYTALAEYKAWNDSAVQAPYGDQTDVAMAAYNALDTKVRDFFLRSKLAAYSNDVAVLDVQSARIEAISADNLTDKMAEIASYPIARISPDALIDLNAPVNPAWETIFRQLKEIVWSKEKTTLSEDDWKTLGDTFAPYAAWKAAQAGTMVASLGIATVEQMLTGNRKAELLQLVEQDKALETEADTIQEVDRLLHLYRDFYTLLKNFVTLQDFYSPDRERKAVFQIGTLVIDRRACHLCFRAEDMGKLSTMAPASGMYLIFCDCTTKNRPDKLQIVAAMTQGDTGELMVGKNAIFYDRQGHDWDAVVTKIIDNPIGIAQAFWSPYRRMAKWVEDLINKRAAEKDSAIMSEATAKLSEKPVLSADKDAKPAQPFDIAKFAGIFAALGMALGMIGTALVSVAKGFVALTWWQAVLVIVGILLLISGPSMIMAWLKLRRRNIAPILNANGWAVNASSVLSIGFGATLTDTAHFPKLKMKDPFAKKGLATWKKWVITLAAAVVVFVGLWLGNLLSWAKLPSPLSYFHHEVVTEVVAEIVTEETVIETVTEEPTAE